MGILPDGDPVRSRSLRVERRGRSDREELGSVEPGLCECGCGTPTRLAPQTDTKRGWVRGRPLRFILGHVNRTKQRPPLDATDYVLADRGFASECWIWAGTLQQNGYPRVCLAGVAQYAHRAMYEQEVGPIPPGLDLDHLCRVPACVNPAHLEPVTHAVNLRRGAIGCDRPGCPDCIAREFVRRLKRAGVTFAGTVGDVECGANLEHWPGTESTVVDDLLTGERTGSF